MKLREREADAERIKQEERKLLEDQAELARVEEAHRRMATERKKQEHGLVRILCLLPILTCFTSFFQLLFPLVRTKVTAVSRFEFNIEIGILRRANRVIEVQNSE